MRGARAVIVIGLGCIVGCGSTNFTTEAPPPPADPEPAAAAAAPPAKPVECRTVADADDPKATLRACEAACDEGDGESCDRVAAHVDATAGHDRSAALPLYDKACGLGHAHACEVAERHRGSMRRAACDEGPTAACVKVLADTRERCKAKEKGACDAHEKLAWSARERFCVEGSVDTCREACDAGLDLACAELGVILLNGERVAADAKRGVALLDKACDAEQIPACNALGRLYSPWCAPKYTCLGTPPKRSVPEDSTRALGYFMRGCAQGKQSECEEVLELQDGGSLAVPKAPLLVALRNICSNGRKEACGRVRDLGEEP